MDDTPEYEPEDLFVIQRRIDATIDELRNLDDDELLNELAFLSGLCTQVENEILNYGDAGKLTDLHKKIMIAMELQSKICSLHQYVAFVVFLKSVEEDLQIEKYKYIAEAYKKYKAQRDRGSFSPLKAKELIFQAEPAQNGGRRSQNVQPLVLTSSIPRTSPSDRGQNADKDQQLDIHINLDEEILEDEHIIRIQANMLQLPNVGLQMQDGRHSVLRGEDSVRISSQLPPRPSEIALPPSVSLNATPTRYSDIPPRLNEILTSTRREMRADLEKIADIPENENFLEEPRASVLQQKESTVEVQATSPRSSYENLANLPNVEDVSPRSRKRWRASFDRVTTIENYERIAEKKIKRKVTVAVERIHPFKKSKAQAQDVRRFMTNRAFETYIAGGKKVHSISAGTGIGALYSRHLLTESVQEVNWEMDLDPVVDQHTPAPIPARRRQTTEEEMIPLAQRRTVEVTKKRLVPASDIPTELAMQRLVTTDPQDAAPVDEVIQAPAQIDLHEPVPIIQVDQGIVQQLLPTDPTQEPATVTPVDQRIVQQLSMPLQETATVTPVDQSIVQQLLPTEPPIMRGDEAIQERVPVDLQGPAPVFNIPQGNLPGADEQEQAPESFHVPAELLHLTGTSFDRTIRPVAESTPRVGRKHKSTDSPSHGSYENVDFSQYKAPSTRWRTFEFVKKTLEEMWTLAEDIGDEKITCVGEILKSKNDLSEANAFALLRIIDEMSLRREVVWEIMDKGVVIYPFEIPYVSEEQFQLKDKPLRS